MKPAEKIQSLTKYVEEHKARLSAPVSGKHAAHPEAYKAYLSLEIKKTERSIEKLRSKL